MRQDRRGMELAVNTLVVLILGIIILVSGIAFMYNLFDTVKGLPDEVDKSTQQKLFNILLTSKKRIAALYNVQTVGWKDSAIYPVAVQNQLEGQEATFRVQEVKMTVEPADSATSSEHQCVDNWNANPAQNPETCPRAEYLDDEFTLSRYDSEAFYVMVYVPSGAVPGEYTFNVDVDHTAIDGTSNSGNYANTKLHVNVK